MGINQHTNRQPTNQPTNRPTPSKMTGAPIELFYFNGNGRASLTRLVFTVGKQEFTDNRVSFPEHAANKANPEHVVSQKYGSMPVLKHGDLLIAQNFAVANYAADIALPGNKDLTPAQRAWDNDLVATLNGDVLSAYYKSMFGTEESKKAGAEALPGAVDKFFGSIEAQLAKGTKGAWVHGRENPSLGDLQIYDIAEKITKVPGVDLKKFAFVSEIIEKVGALEGVKELYQQ